MNEIAKIMDEVSRSVCDTCLKAVISFAIYSSRPVESGKITKNVRSGSSLYVNFKKLIGNLNWNERILLMVKKFNIGDAFWVNAVFFHPGPQKLIY